MADPSTTIGMESTLERLARVAYRAMAPAWSRDDPEGWIEEHRRVMAQMGAVLGAEAMMLADAREAGWDVVAPEVITEHSLVMRLPDGRIGYHMPDRRYGNAPDKRLGNPIREHLSTFLRGDGGGIRQDSLPELPSMCRQVLRADGLDPDAVERLGALVHRIALTVEGRHHVAAFGVQEHLRHSEMDRMDGGDRRIHLERYEWSSVKMVLSKDPAVHVLDGRMTARVILPSTIVSSLVGRPATTVFDHRALDGYTIRRATQRPSGFTIALTKD